jgi:ornithine lipid ester-linked acyl 2-hydroxylase
VLSAEDYSWLSEGRKRQTLTARLLVRILPSLEGLNRKCSKVGNAPVLDNAAFPWVREIESEWRTIRAELDRLLSRKDELPSFQDILPDVGSVSSDRGWKSFMFSGMGVESHRNIGLCPETWRILKNTPGLSTAMFSIFEPGKYISPHRGIYNGVLRLHLGLIVPETSENVAIRVGSQVCHWEEGAALIFDDTYEHEAWNKSDRVRVVLFADFARPLRFPANIVNWLLLKLTAHSHFVREAQVNQRSWETNFYGN